MPKRYLYGPTIRKVMQRNAWKDFANWRIKRLSIFSKLERHAWMIINLGKKKMDQLENCPQFAQKSFWYVYLARIGRLDILWSANKFARAVTKWTKSCDKRLARLISYIHHTCEYRLYCYVGNSAQQCRWGLFQDSDFAGDLEDLKPASGGILCIFGSHTFVSTSWMCKKQTSVSHRSTEAEIMSLVAGFRMDCILALNLWDTVIEVLFHSSPNQTNKTKDVREPRGKFVGKLNQTCENRFQPRTPILIWPMLITFHQAEHILVLCFIVCLPG